MDRIDKLNMNDGKHFDYGCSYTEGKPENGFEFRIYNKKNNKIRAKVNLDKTQLLGLANSILKCFGDEMAE